MPVPKHIPAKSSHPGNVKVMVYVPPEVHRAVRQVALDERRSASDVYAEAARAFLVARGAEIGAAHEPRVAHRTSGIVELVEAIDRQGRQIEEIVARVEASFPAARRDSDSPPAGTTAAVAVEALLDILRQAGAAGLPATEFRAAVQASGIRSGTAEVAKAVLRAAGVVRCEGRRWYLDRT